jgi:cytochrome b
MQVWDLSTRLYHWLQAVLLVLLVVTGNSGDGPHVDFGIALAVLVLWRLMWGIWGSETNRFTQFVRSPVTTVKYILGKVKAGVGHNPAGGWMVVALLVALLAQCVSGFAMAGILDYLPYADDWLTDDLFDLLETVHVYGADMLQILVAIHVLAIIIYKLRGKPLVKAMVTGRQDAGGPDQAPYMVSQWRALLLVVFISAVMITFVSQA